MRGQLHLRLAARMKQRERDQRQEGAFLLGKLLAVIEPHLHTGSKFAWKRKLPDGRGGVAEERLCLFPDYADREPPRSINIDSWVGFSEIGVVVAGDRRILWNSLTTHQLRWLLKAAPKLIAYRESAVSPREVIATTFGSDRKDVTEYQSGRWKPKLWQLDGWIYLVSKNTPPEGHAGYTWIAHGDQSVAKQNSVTLWVPDPNATPA